MSTSEGMETPLEKKVVFITGAARRLGHAFAIASARAGADVVIHYHTSKVPAEATAAEIAAMGRRAWVLEADLAEPEAAVKLMERAFALGPVHGLVNNAAIFGGGTLAETSVEDWRAHLAVNLTAPFVLTQAFGRLLGESGLGRVVNLLDWRASMPQTDHFAYTISKSALAAMTKSLARSMAPNVSVNGLALGAFLPPDDRAPDASITRKIPLGRWGDVAEAAHALIFLLAGPAYITGEILYLDGGRHLL